MKETSESSLAPSTVENIVCVCVYVCTGAQLCLTICNPMDCVCVCVCVFVYVYVYAQVLLCLTLCNPMDFSPPNSSVLKIFQARILEWDVISS